MKTFFFALFCVLAAASYMCAADAVDMTTAAIWTGIGAGLSFLAGLIHVSPDKPTDADRKAVEKILDGYRIRRQRQNWF